MNSAELAKNSGCKRFLHVSSQGSNKNSCLLYPQTKVEREWKEERQRREIERFICFLFSAQSNTLENSNISIIWMQSCVMDNITFSSFFLKGRVEEELQELQFDHLSIFRPGCVFIRSKRFFFNCCFILYTIIHDSFENWSRKKKSWVCNNSAMVATQNLCRKVYIYYNENFGPRIISPPSTMGEI